MTFQVCLKRIFIFQLLSTVRPEHCQSGVWHQSLAQHSISWHTAAATAAHSGKEKEVLAKYSSGLEIQVACLSNKQQYLHLIKLCS